MMPVWLLLVVMVLTAYRLTRFVVKDDFPPMLWLRDTLAGGWRPLSLKEREIYHSSPVKDKAVLQVDWSYNPDDEEPQRYVRRAGWSPYWLSELMSCPWCVSAWISGALTAGTDLTVGVPAPWLVAGAVWALAALLASREWA